MPERTSPAKQKPPQNIKQFVAAVKMAYLQTHGQYNDELLVDRHIQRLLNVRVPPVPKKGPWSFMLSRAAKVQRKRLSCFNVPPGLSCPGRTPTCSASCYASKKRGVMPEVKAAQLHNLQLLLFFENTHPNGFRVAADLLASQIPDSAEEFRWHSAGDVYNQWYLDLIVDVCRQRNDVPFWMYTRSFHLDFLAASNVQNLQLFASADPDNMEEAYAFQELYGHQKIRLAYGPWDHNTPMPPNSFACPAVTGRIPVDNACAACRLCVHKGRLRKDVVFHAH